VKRILLDCDGVLADFIGEALETIVAHGGPRHTPEDVTEFDFVKSLGLDLDLARRVKRTISTEPGWWYGLDPFPEARAGVDALRKIADVYVVTSPWNSHPTWLHEREEWLKKHFEIPHSHVVACSAKHIVHGDMIVDDKTSALVTWMEYRTHADHEAVQWITPHNRRDGWTGRSTQSWQQLATWIEEMP
jgi:5'(3')-deoxyribonucleotidase